MLALDGAALALGHLALTGGRLADAAIGLQFALAYLGEIFVELGAHQVAAGIGRIAGHGIDGGAGAQRLAHLRAQQFRRHVIDDDFADMAGGVAGDRPHRLDDEAGVAEAIGQQRRVDDALQLRGRTPAAMRQVGQRRAHGVGAEQAGHENERVEGDGDRQCQIGELVAVEERVPADDEAMGLVVT